MKIILTILMSAFFLIESTFAQSQAGNPGDTSEFEEARTYACNVQKKINGTYVDKNNDALTTTLQYPYASLSVETSGDVEFNEFRFDDANSNEFSVVVSSNFNSVRKVTLSLHKYPVSTYAISGLNSRVSGEAIMEVIESGKMITYEARCVLDQPLNR